MVKGGRSIKEIEHSLGEGRKKLARLKTTLVEISRHVADREVKGARNGDAELTRIVHPG
jgi:hypothetical protein